MEKNKAKIKKLTLALLKESYEASKLKVEKALNSGAIDISDWSPDYMPLIEPKTILIAVLQDQADQYACKGTYFEKRITKNVKNLRLFL